MKSLLPLLASMALLSVPGAEAASYSVVVNTTPLASSAGFLAFDLLAGSAGASNDIVVSAFATSGSLGSGSAAGSVTGNLVPGPLRLSSATSFFNEWVQGITFGAQIRFEFSLTQSLGGGIPDNFSFYLLNASQVPLATSDPLGANAAFSVNLDSSALPQAYLSSFFTITVLPLAVIPEPPALWLMALGLVAAISSRRVVAARALAAGY